ncbi:hypothetical protein ACFYT4_09495 [Streptomyces sp. NPDC004609]|uniref:hypothetical protein n=1 Tax=Streptomyces sp. NPDC004609 TaxID=3364704 RepID=UPI0036D0F82A
MADSTPDPAAPGDHADARLLHLRTEVGLVVEEARIGARRAQRRSKLWNATYICLGFPAAVLAGISGAAGLAAPGARVPAAVLALLSAGFSAGSTFFRADARQVANLRRRYAWQHLETQARLVLAHQAYEGVEQLHAALVTLLDIRAAIPSSALVLTELPPPASPPPIAAAPQLPPVTPSAPGS